jgi:cyclopropane-fatty-acyl-phospholipid synthase
MLMQIATDTRAGKVHQFFTQVSEKVKDLAPFELQLPGHPPHRFGSGNPSFTIGVRNDDGITAVLSGDEAAIADAYMNGAIDLEGDMLAILSMRNALTDRHPLLYLWWVRLQPLLFGQVNRDREWVSQHYDYDEEFFLNFIDKRWRTYSHAVFEDENESLESAETRKLAFALKSCNVKPGERVLDIGGGWGAFVEFAGSQGVQVTSLTISEKSREFVQRLIDEKRLPCRILLEHFYDHVPDRPYDAIVNIGVTEHLPDYRRTLEHYVKLLKPGGRIYLDASAAREKWDFSSFIYRHIFPGNPTPMCLAEYVAEVERSPLEIIELQNDRKSYELTARHWAQNLDNVRQEIVTRWGEPLYRKFRLYLWGTTHVFATGLCDAYRLVLQRPVFAGDVRRWKG